VASSLASYWFVLGGLIAALGGVVVLKRYRTSLQGFEHLEQLMGGHLPRASSVLLLGDPGSGKTVLSYQLLWDELESGKVCALLSYDAFPEDVEARMREFGWDIIPYLRKGRLKIIDCYSGLTGEGQGAIRDPSDLTELNIQVTSFITKAKGGAVTLVLDSLTPIFNGVDAKQAINFIQTVGAKVKKTGGLFLLTASQGAVPSDPVAKIKSIVDGIIELSLVRSGRRVSRYLSVVKMERRRISPAAIPIEIDRERGLVFHVSRLTTIKDQIVKAVPLHSAEPESAPRAGSVTHERPTRQTPTSGMGKPGKSSITPESDTSEYDASGLRRPGAQRRERNES
jgi:KaiC/GvpD/RAD55 family RecA-like ATPase